GVGGRAVALVGGEERGGGVEGGGDRRARRPGGGARAIPLGAASELRRRRARGDCGTARGRRVAHRDRVHARQCGHPRGADRVRGARARGALPGRGAAGRAAALPARPRTSAGGMTDLVVVGGGPVGLAAAIHAADRGLSAVVLERRTPPLDKACGEGLMPPGVAALGALGVVVPEHARAPFVGIRYVDGDTVAEARFADGPGWGVRRT